MVGVLLKVLHNGRVFEFDSSRCHDFFKRPLLVELLLKCGVRTELKLMLKIMLKFVKTDRKKVENGNVRK